MKKYLKISLIIITIGIIFFSPRYLDSSKIYIENETQTVKSSVYAALTSDGKLFLSSNPITKKLKKNYEKIKIDQFYPNWNKDAYQIKTVIIEDDIYPTSCYQWFYDCINLTEIKNIERLHTSQCKDIERMFYNCEKLKDINVSNFDISKCINLTELFAKCKSLERLDLRAFNTKNILDMRYMFEECKNLKEVKVSNQWNTDTIDTEGIFDGCEINTVTYD